MSNVFILKITSNTALDRTRFNWWLLAEGEVPTNYNTTGNDVLAINGEPCVLFGTGLTLHFDGTYTEGTMYYSTEYVDPGALPAISLYLHPPGTSAEITGNGTLGANQILLIEITHGSESGIPRFSWYLYDEGETPEYPNDVYIAAADNVYLLGTDIVLHFDLDLTYDTFASYYSYPYEFDGGDAIAMYTYNTGGNTVPEVLIDSALYLEVFPGYWVWSTAQSLGDITQDVKIQITTGGNRATAKFRWSIDDDLNWDEQNVSAGASIEIYNQTEVQTITIEFPEGTYVQDTYYTSYLAPELDAFAGTLFNAYGGDIDTPPDVYYEGTVDDERLRIIITAPEIGGTREQTTFSWSLNGGGDYEETDVQAAATVVLGTSGFTVHFSQGIYNYTMDYKAYEPVS